LRQAAGIIRAAEAACSLGLPFNRHVVIHLEKAGVTDRDAAKAIGAFLRMVRDWLRKAGFRTAGAWVRENGESKGSHVHILMHLPVGASWHFQRSRRWLERITGNGYRKGVIVTKCIRGSANPEALFDLYRANLKTLVAYLVKGVRQEQASALRIANCEFSGFIIGKRAGWSQNVGNSGRSLK